MGFREFELPSEDVWPAGFTRLNATNSPVRVTVGTSPAIPLGGPAGVAGRPNVPSTVTTWELRNHLGVIVGSGGSLSGSFSPPSSLPCGWYRLYFFGSGGSWMGGGAFIVARDVSGMTSWSLGVLGAQLHIGSKRMQIQDAGNPSASYGDVDAALASITSNYDPLDSARPKPKLLAFPYGVGGSPAGVTAAAARYPTIDYWEGYNEPFGVPDARFVSEMAEFYGLVKAVLPAAKVCGPCPVVIDYAAQTALDAFFAAGGGSSIDAISFHNYNGHMGDLRCGRSTMDLFVSILTSYGQQNKPRINTEAGGYFAAESGAGTYMRQATCAMLDVLLHEQYGVQKESWFYFYEYSHGFDSFPSWLVDESGHPYPAVGMLLTHSQELLGTTWEARHDFGTVDNDFTIGSSYRRSDGTGVVSVMTTGKRDHPITYQVTGGSPTSLTVVDCWGNESSVTVAGGLASVNVQHVPSYVRLPAGVTLTPVATGARYGASQMAGSSVASSAGTLGVTLIGSLIDRTFPNRLLGNASNDLADQYSVWQSGAPLTTTSPQYVTVTFPESRPVSGAIVHCPPPWQAALTSIIAGGVEAFIGGVWVQVGTINEPITAIAAPSTKQDGVNGWVDSFSQEIHIFEVAFPEVQTTAVRVRADTVTFGGAPSLEAFNAFGAMPNGAPTTAGMGTTTPRMAMQSLYLYATSPGAPPPPTVHVDMVEHAGELTRRFRAGQLGEGTDMPGQETLYVTAGDIESLQEDHYATVDPTGVTVYFGTSTSSEVAPTNWTAGAWSGAWSSTTRLATAVSPTLGATGATITIAAGSTVVLWVKFTVSSETVVEPVGTVVAK